MLKVGFVTEDNVIEFLKKDPQGIEMEVITIGNMKRHYIHSQDNELEVNVYTKNDRLYFRRDDETYTEFVDYVVWFVDPAYDVEDKRDRLIPTWDLLRLYRLFGLITQERYELYEKFMEVIYYGLSKEMISSIQRSNLEETNE